MKRIAIFASGAGTNAEKLIVYFELHRDAQVTLLVSNKKEAGAVKIARDRGVETLVVDRDEFNSQDFVEELKVHGIDLVVLAGFLWLVPVALIKAFPKKILNIHPALLPKFGGKGMYGQKVHEAVLAAGETESGITIHLVNEHFDEGEQLAQFSCPVFPNDTAETLAVRIHELEHRHFATVVDEYLKTL